VNTSYIRYVIIFLLAFIFQATLIAAVQIRNWKPDLIIIFLVMFALQHGKSAGSTAGFVIGIIGDVVSWKLLGVGALSKTITGYIAGGTGRFFQERSHVVFTFLFTLLISGFLHDFIFFYINTLGKEISWAVLIFAQIIPNLLYTAIVGTVIYSFLGKWLNEDEQF
jgi:rod shape-determining protein MreD